MIEFKLPKRKCHPEPHVHVMRDHHQVGDSGDMQVTIGRNYDARDGYGQRLAVEWHGIDEFPVDYTDVLGLDPVIAERLARYVG